MQDARTSNVIVAVGAAIACGAQWLIMGRAVTPLVIALVISYALWAGRETWPVGKPVILTYGVAFIVQCAHLVEEYRTGFYRAFPPLLGAEPWSAGRFLAFNLAWLVIFALGAIGIARSARPAYVIALFLAIGGGIGNGLGHLGLAAQRGGYFPGAYTALIALVAGSVLLGVLNGVSLEFHRFIARAMKR